jgi:Putative prokaryotic signal transducing protein
MRIVYQSTNVADLYVLRDVLAQAGIEAHVQGEFLRGGIGELPADTPVSLAVADAQADAARTIILDWERSRPEHDDAEDAIEAAASAPSGSARRGGSGFAVVAAFLLGAVCSGAIVWAIYNHPAQGPVRDFDGDGNADERVFLAGDRIDRVEYDRNDDGKVDRIVYYAPDHLPDHAEFDRDFDGRFEGRVRYADNEPAEWTMDLDGDGVVDMREVYADGVLAKEETFDKHAQITRTIQYSGGLPVSGEFDSDGDGVLDTARTYDARGEIVASKPLAAGQGR